MDKMSGTDQERLISFWNDAFTMTDEDRRQAAENADPEKDWKDLAPSEKLLKAAYALGGRKHVLDYGCGYGWAGIAAAKGGCEHVLCADAAPAGVEMARFYSALFGTGEYVECRHVSADWLAGEPDGKYDGFICSNVLDVIPPDAAEEILRSAARVTSEDAEIVIGLNFRMAPKDDPERHITVKNGNRIYINGILRMVSRTDEEWAEIFGRYFRVESLDHFAWPGEKNETRRLFRLKKKNRLENTAV